MPQYFPESFFQKPWLLEILLTFEKSRSKRYIACSDVVRLKGLEPTRIAAREPKSFGLFFRPQLSTALRSRKPLKTQGFVHFRARLRRENKMQNFLVGENQGENSQRTGENFLGPITGRTNYDKPHDPLLMAILQEVVKHEVESILRGNLFSIP